MVIDTNDIDLEIFTALHLPGNLKLIDILITITTTNITIIMFIWLFSLLQLISSVFPFNFRTALGEGIALLLNDMSVNY